MWVHLILCFSKIDKPQVTLKCLARAMQEIGQLLAAPGSDKIIADQAPENDPDSRAFLVRLNALVEEI